MSKASTPEEGHRIWMEAFNAGDIDTVMALYEPDAVMVGEDGQLARGHEAIRAVVEEFRAAGLPLRMEAGTTIVAGDIAQVSSRWTIEGLAADGSAVQMAGKTADVYRRQPDGGWKCIIDNPNGGGG